MIRCVTLTMSPPSPSDWPPQLAIQNAKSGGDFEYSPHLRTPTDENYAGVEAVLDGVGRLIRTLRLEPGDLQIFKGRYSLHRVTPLAGSRACYVAIFSYVEEPGMVGSPKCTRQLYGRVLPITWSAPGCATTRWSISPQHCGAIRKSVLTQLCSVSKFTGRIIFRSCSVVYVHS